MYKTCLQEGCGYWQLNSLLSVPTMKPLASGRPHFRRTNFQLSYSVGVTGWFALIHTNSFSTFISSTNSWLTNPDDRPISGKLGMLQPGGSTLWAEQLLKSSNGSKLFAPFAHLVSGAGNRVRVCVRKLVNAITYEIIDLASPHLVCGSL